MEPAVGLAPGRASARKARRQSRHAPGAPRLDAPVHLEIVERRVISDSREGGEHVRPAILGTSRSPAGGRGAVDIRAHRDGQLDRDAADERGWNREYRAPCSPAVDLDRGGELRDRRYRLVQVNAIAELFSEARCEQVRTADEPKLVPALRPKS